MKSKKILATVLAATFLASTALIGCGKKAETPAPAPAATETKIDKDQTINIIGYDYTSLDASVVSDSESFTALTNTMEGLVREKRDDKGTLETVLAGASKIDKSADGLTWTFTLRDAKWSDGKPVTAADYEYSWKRLCNPKVSQDYLTFLGDVGVKGAEAAASGKGSIDDIGVKAKDDKTLVVTLDYPFAGFESAVGFKGLVPERKDIVEKLGDQYGQDYKNMVYNGAFTISEYAKGSKIVYKKNPGYWDAANVKLETANGFIVSEPATLIKMFDANELDVTGATGDDVAKLAARAKNGEFQHIKGEEASVFYFVFNTKTKVLSNPKVRLALSLAYDRQQHLDAVFKRNVPGSGIVPDNMTVGGKEFRKETPDPLKSIKDDPKKLLADGLKELGMDPDPSKITLKLLASKATATTTGQAQFIQNQWKTNLGINLSITHAVDSPSYFKARTNGEFDVCTGGWGADFNDLDTFFGLFMTGNGNNNGKYSSKTYDDLVVAAKKEQDGAKRLKLYQDAEKQLVVTDAAVSPYYYRDIQQFRKNYVKGFYIPQFNGYYDLKYTYIQGKQ